MTVTVRRTIGTRLSYLMQQWSFRKYYSHITSSYIKMYMWCAIFGAISMDNVHVMWK